MDHMFSSGLIFPTVSLGELIDYLGQRDQSANVEFDFCGAFPAIDGHQGLASYRGWYEHLAIGWRHNGPGQFCTVSKLSMRLRQALYESFDGYKGGTYRMDAKTLVWVDNWGECTSTAIVGAKVLYHGTIILRTERVEF